MIWWNHEQRAGMQREGHPMSNPIKRLERLTMWLAWKLPRRLVYWTFIRMAVDGTTVPPGDKSNPAERTVIEAMEWWDKRPALYGKDT